MFPVNGTLQIPGLVTNQYLAWSNPASISYGAPLGTLQLNAFANVPGTYTYTPPAGTVLNAEAAQRCLDAGAQFLVSPGINLKTLEFAQRKSVLMLAGALTPTEVMSAWEFGADLVKIFPCSQVGGASYIRALKGPFPDIPLVPTGGVNLDTCAEFIAAGASALGVGGELILKDAIRQKNAELISGLARQMLQAVQTARAARPKA